MDWRHYAISLAIGLCVGAASAALGGVSPAPPVTALLGLLGILAGETIFGWAKDRMSAAEAAAACLHAKRFTVADSGAARSKENA